LQIRNPGNNKRSGIEKLLQRNRQLLYTFNRNKMKPTTPTKKPKGRTKKIETKTNISIHTHIHKGIFAHLSKISNDTGVSKQYLIEKAIMFYFNLRTEKHRGKLIVTTINALQDFTLNENQ
jgi:hypothetical protein